MSVFRRHKSNGKGRPNISGPTDVTINHGPSSLLDTLQNSNTPPPTAPPLRLSSSQSFSSLLSFRSSLSGGNTPTGAVKKTERSYLENDDSIAPHLSRQRTLAIGSRRRASVSSLENQQSTGLHFSASSSPGTNPASSMYLSPAPNHKVIDTVLALHSYGTENSNDSLSFHKGDVLRVLLKLDSGWWDGLNPQGQRGWFPSNYVTPLDPNPAPTTTTCPLLDVAAASSPISTTTIPANSSLSEQPSGPPSPELPSPRSKQLFAQNASNNSIMNSHQSPPLSSHKQAQALNFQFSSSRSSSSRSVDPSDPLAPPTTSASSTPVFVQTRRSNNSLATANPVFNNVFDNDSDSLASAKTGDNSRKGSIVSFMSSNTPSAEGSEPSLLDPTCADYKYLEVINSFSEVPPELSRHWIPQTTKSGKLYYVNSALKVYTPSIPFETISPQAAETLSNSSLPKHFDPPPDVTGLALLHEHSTPKNDAADNTKSYVLSRATDPYIDLVCNL